MRRVASFLKLFSLYLWASFSIYSFAQEAQPADQDVLKEHMKEVVLVGSTRFRVAFWNVYDIALYAESAPYNAIPPYALEISYLRSISKEELVDRSIELIEAQGFDDMLRLDTWQQRMLEVFPDVERGTVLTGIYTSEGQSVFYMDGLHLGTTEDPDFGQYFFDIWLGEDTSEPRMRRDLIGIIDE